MSKIIASESDLDKILNECPRLFVLFYASWCPFSQRFLPIFEKYAEGNEQKFCRVVTDQTPECEEKYSIAVVPTVIYFENGRAVKRLNGAPGSGLVEQQLSSLIRSCELSGGNDGKITVTKDGPYQVSGSIPLAKEIVISDTEGTPVHWEHGQQFPLQGTYYLCRCGHSKNKPFCDGAHTKKSFNGTETAPDILYKDQAETIRGPGLVLSDDESLCAIARFCHRAGDAWTLTEKSQDPSSKETAIQEAGDCPSGRLVARDPKTGEPFEPKFAPAIGIVEDPDKKFSGPLWVKGRIPLQGAGGRTYEVRNRVTLCRCGKSKNKPFCDGTHCSIGFKDGDPSVE